MIRIVCHMVVMLWIGAYLAWSALAPPAGTPAAPELARVEPRPDPAPKPEPSVQDPPLPHPAPEPPAAIDIGSREIAEGDRLLRAGGAFPALSASYESFSSFPEYARAMQDLGARFVVVRAREVVGEVDLASGAVTGFEAAGGFSPRARDYTDEPALASVTRSALGRFGAGTVVMMLVPRQLDAGLFGGIARSLSERGDSHERYREIRAHYERSPAGGVAFRVESAVRKDGTEAPLDLVFDLSAIVRAGAPEPRA